MILALNNNLKFFLTATVPTVSHQKWLIWKLNNLFPEFNMEFFNTPNLIDFFGEN